MDTTGSVVPACLEELREALRILQPELVGLQEQRVLPNSDATNDLLDTQIAEFTQRRDLLRQGILTLQTLEDDGYPTIHIIDVPQETFEELERHVLEMEYSLGHIRRMARLNTPTDVEAGV